MYLANSSLAAAAANGVSTALTGGQVFLYAGPVPANANAALDMVSSHTEVAILTVDGEGTGLSFDPSTDGFLYKSALEVWKGLVSFDGADAGETTLTPTFFRFVASGDNPREEGTDPRLQGTVSGQNGNGDMKLVSPTVTANGSNEVGIAGFYIELTNLVG